MGVDLDHQQPVRIASGHHQLVVGGPEVEGEVDGPVRLGRRRLHRHHPGGEAAEDGGELPEPTRYQVDVRPLGQHHPLGGPEEAAPVGDGGLGEDGVVAEQEGATELQVLPVVALTEGGEEGVRVGRSEAESDRVAGSDQRGGFGRGADGGGHDPVCHPRSAHQAPCRTADPRHRYPAGGSMDG